MKTEEEIQNEIMEALHENGYYFFRIHTQGIARVIKGKLVLTPNGGRIINKETGERMGSMKGFSDLLIMCENGLTIYMEIKNEKGKQSEDQIKFERNCLRLGHCYIVVRSAKEAIDKIEQILDAQLIRKSGVNEI